MSERYVVEVKPSARRTNGAVGKAVNSRGARREFDDREAAEGWADDLAADGNSTVWIRDANPNDESDVDAYLMGRLRSSSAAEDRGDHSAGDQARMPAYEPENA